MSRPCLEQDSASLPLDIPKHPERDDDGAYASAPSWKLKLGHRTTPRLSAYAHCFETAKSRTLDRCAGYKHCRKLLYTYWLLQGQTNDTVQTPEPHFQTRTRHSKIHQHGFKNHNLNQKILGKSYPCSSSPVFSAAPIVWVLRAPTGPSTVASSCRFPTCHNDGNDRSFGKITGKQAAFFAPTKTRLLQLLVSHGLWWVLVSCSLNTRPKKGEVYHRHRQVSRIKCPKISIAPGNWRSQKENGLATTIFWGRAASFREGTNHVDSFCLGLAINMQHSLLLKPQAAPLQPHL